MSGEGGRVVVRFNSRHYRLYDDDDEIRRAIIHGYCNNTCECNSFISLLPVNRMGVGDCI